MQVTYFKLKNPSEDVREQILTAIVEFVDAEKFEYEQYVEDFGENEDAPEGIAFSFLPVDQSNKLIETFDTFGILIESNDITTNVLAGDFENNKFWIEIFKSDKDQFYSHGFEMLKDFLRKNLTKDIVLDKINEKGFDKLTEIDLEILKSEE